MKYECKITVDINKFVDSIWLFAKVCACQDNLSSYNEFRIILFLNVLLHFSGTCPPQLSSTRAPDATLCSIWSKWSKKNHTLTKIPLHHSLKIFTSILTSMVLNRNFENAIQSWARTSFWCPAGTILLKILVSWFSRRSVASINVFPFQCWLTNWTCKPPTPKNGLSISSDKPNWTQRLVRNCSTSDIQKFAQFYDDTPSSLLVFRWRIL